MRLRRFQAADDGTASRLLIFESPPRSCRAFETKGISRGGESPNAKGPAVAPGLCVLRTIFC
jgi:hypothetical protein